MVNLLSSNQYKSGSFKKVRSGDTIYIYIVGGITWAEYQSFNLLGEKLKVKFVLCST